MFSQGFKMLLTFKNKILKGNSIQPSIFFIWAYLFKSLNCIITEYVGRAKKRSLPKKINDYEKRKKNEILEGMNSASFRLKKRKAKKELAFSEYPFRVCEFPTAGNCRLLTNATLWWNSYFRQSNRLCFFLLLLTLRICRIVGTFWKHFELEFLLLND